MNWFKNIFNTQRPRIFLDYASATPLIQEVKLAMGPYFSREFYNPNAIYTEGVKVKQEVEKFRSSIAKILGVGAKDIYFTSGGTESNTWAVRGVKNAKVFIAEDSHPSVSDAAKHLIKTLTWESATLISSVTPDNTLGRQVRELRKKNNSQFPLLHIDASQTALYYPVGLEILACDLLTLDSAKLYGPKGVGILVVRPGVKIDLPPLGTSPVPLIAGMAKALEIAARDREKEFKRLHTMSSRLEEALSKALPEIEIERIEPNVVNVSVPGILPELLVLALDRAGVLVSAGPACNADKPEPPETPVRLSLGRFTTEKEVNQAIEIFCQTVKNLLKLGHAAI